MNKGARFLRAYLKDIDFNNIYKYIVGVNNYYLSPYVVNEHYFKNSSAIKNLLGDFSDYNLLKLLMFLEKISISQLSKKEIDVCEALVESNIIYFEDGYYISLGYQLISAMNKFLLIDGKINYKSIGKHNIYIGIDTYMLLNYIDNDRSVNGRGLDLCTGSGIVGIYLSQFMDKVVATDIEDIPLKISNFNRMLNGLEKVLEIKNEDFEKTLEKEEKYDVITCNPPFVAFPKELSGPVFGVGTGEDGLDFYRSFLEKSSRVLTDTGKAYFVGDFIGDETGPYFIKELREYSRKHGLRIDIIIDNKLDVKEQLKVYPSLLKTYNPQMSLKELEIIGYDFLINKLKAKYYYLGTLVVSKSIINPSVNILNRYNYESKKVINYHSFTINTGDLNYE